MDYQEYQVKQPLAEQPKKRIGKKAFLSVLILVILVVAGWFLYENLRGPVINDTLPDGYVFNNLGQFPEGFPVELILNRDSSKWQRSEDTLSGAGERIRVVELLYPNPSETFETDLAKHIESFSWKSIEANGSGNSSYTVYELSGNRFILTSTKTDTGLFINMSLITYVLE